MLGVGVREGRRASHSWVLMLKSEEGAGHVADSGTTRAQPLTSVLKAGVKMEAVWSPGTGLSIGPSIRRLARSWAGARGSPR